MDEENTNIQVENIEVDPIKINSESLEEEPSIDEKDTEDLDQAYYDFMSSLHDTLYKRLLNIEIEKEKLNALNRSGANVFKKLDKLNWIYKYGDFFVYGINTVEAITAAIVEKRKAQIENDSPKKTPKQKTEIQTKKEKGLFEK